MDHEEQEKKTREIAQEFKAKQRRNWLLVLLRYLAKHPKISSLTVGLLSVFSFAPYFNFVVACGCFVVLMHLLLETDGWKEKFKLGYIFGFGYFAAGFAWIGNAVLVEPDEFGWLYPVILVLAGSFFGLFVAVPAACMGLTRDKFGEWLVFCGMWVIAEWVRSWFLTGFPWNLLGYSWAFNPELIQNAAIGGVYLTSLLVIMAYTVWGLLLNVYIESLYADSVDNIMKRLFKRSYIAVLIMVIVFGGNLLWGKARIVDMQTGNVTVRIVQPSIPQTMKWTRELAEDNFQTYINLSSAKSDKRPDWVIWGETASPFRLDEDEEHRARAVDFLEDKELLISGMVSYHDNRGKFLPHNSMVIVDAKGEVRGYYDKSHLVPFGEYIPLRKYLPKFLRPVANAIGEFGRGNGAKTFAIENYPLLGGAICYEIIFPHEVADRQTRPEVIVNLTNDGWYGESAGPYQHWVAAMFRAVEEGIPVVRVANNGISGMINAFGEEKIKMALNEVGYRDFELEKALAKSTVYSRFGNLPIIILCLILVAVGVIRRHRRQVVR